MADVPRHSPGRDRGRELDLVLVGATGFVGRLTAEHLAAAAPSSMRVGLAGRSAQRLSALQAHLGPPAADWALVEVDVLDPAAVDRLARRTRVVATTVGPYLKYGLPLVEACASAGTHYADLTGEVLFTREAIDRVHERALSTGARVVHSCGFDSVPSDLGVALLARAAADDGAGTLTDTVLLVRSAKGGLSGGTFDSLRTEVDELARDPSRTRAAADPYALSPDRAAEPEPGDERDRAWVERDPRWGWTAPFVMAAYNARIVRRSNALQGWAYGRAFRYRERVATGRSPAAPLLAGAIAGVTAAAYVGMSLPPTRRLLDRVLPKPGEGPGEQARRTGHFRMDLHTTTTTGRRYRAVVAAQGDPGYAATAVMLGQSALALALGDARMPDAAGDLTPATGLGDALVQRLRTCGFRLDVGT